ncbi:MAG: iron-sulfur cluster assembly accessory protein [Deltaproteobacteria bacterium]|nr:iron-sulfur cluster assembly accessory protein [Deltaproteobacteria bacterium]
MQTETTSPSNPATTSQGAPLTLTPAAVAQVKQVMEQNNFQGFVFAVKVVPAGCSGMGYDLNLVKDAAAGDTVFEQDGIKIATDALSAQYLGGTVVDYVNNIQGAGFKFSNPNAKSTCGCGTSFSA